MLVKPHFAQAPNRQPSRVFADCARLEVGNYPLEIDVMLYELRIYHCLPGRLPALLNRFENTTLAIWERLGIRQAGFWTTWVGESNHDLYYLLEWQSLAQRDEKWLVFQADAEWIEKRAASEADGPIVATISNQILAPTAFSSIK